MKAKQRLTMIETNYHHLDSGIEKLFSKLDKHEEKVDSRFRTLEKMMYIGFGVVLAMQFLISSGIIKIGQ